ncbi:AMP-binding protein [Luteimonas vadosa]|uniref:Xanthomonadin biosynthesis 3-hydroxybenozate--AMP ligase XanA2 n=1 Tax=Luteimonas vadosa TaxID=1165507 RepID=A0ABP9DT41_9GAMM
MSANLQSFDAGHAAPSARATCALAIGSPDRAIAFDRHGQTPLSTFFAHVRGLAATLPDRPFALNLCDNRYRFLVAFCAVAVRGQATLLPPARTRAAIDDVRAQHPDSYCLGDADPCGCDAQGMPPHYVHVARDLPTRPGGTPHVAPDALVAIGFTSGSTGHPTPNRKTWASFRTSTAQNLEALAGLWREGEQRSIVATVPSQHMYGMEMSVLLPLLGEAAVHRGRPFFPQDIANALHDAPGSRLLVTTPVHLRALVDAAAGGGGLRLPPLAGIVSATAPLPQALAAAAESHFGCEVRELFGSTETCVIARRRTASERAWTPLRGVSLQPRPDGAVVHADHLAGPVALADLVDVAGDGRFELRGRQSDLLEIAGKRASLGDLTRRLLAIPGVEDGVVFQLDARDDDGVRRIAALVVAPGLAAPAIREAMRCAVDPVFLPRPLRCVPALPRNETGKLPRAALLRMLHGNID